MYVKNCMTPDPITIRPGEDVKFAFHLLRKHRFRQVPVVKDGKLVGIITDRDLRGVIDQENIVVESIMTPDPITILEDATLEGAAQILRNRKINALPVLSKNNELVGIITVTDVFDGLLNLMRFHEEPERIQVKLNEGVDLFDVIKLFQIYSEKVVSFTASGEDNLTYYFWVINCDYDKINTKLKEKCLSVTFTHY
ncbi:MAG: CBS domain-containing protein [Thermodesulfobacteriota bacterium]